MEVGINPHSPQASNPAESLWTRAGLGCLLGVLLIRAAYSAAFPLDLAPDESYYWDWGRHPDIGYYSKPPMIGWLMGFAGWLGHDSMFVLKFLPALLVLGGLIFVFLLGRDLFGARAGFWAALLLLATPANAALSTFFTIDAPLFLFWSASLWLAWRWWRAAPRGGSWGLALALALSLGLGSLTKQIHLLFPVLLLGFVALAGLPGGARTRWQLGIAIALSLLLLAPPLLWNWRHDWITFRHTAGELQEPSHGLGRSLRLLGEFLGGQAALGGGATWLGMLVAAALGLRRWTTADARMRFLLLFFVPGLVAFAVLALLQRVEQNWPLVFYTSAGILFAGAVRTASRPNGGLGRLAKAGVILGGIFTVALLAVPFLWPASRWAGAHADPTARVRGWRKLAQAVQSLRESVPDAQRTFLYSPADRYVASALAFYLPDHPTTYAWDDIQHPKSQYDIWGPPRDKQGWDALVIGRNVIGSKVVQASRDFSAWESLGEIAVPLGPDPRRSRRYQVYLGRGFRPPPGPASRRD